MRKLIKVEQKHINSGLIKSYHSCPIALALKDEGFDYISVTGIINYRDNHGIWHKQDSPRSALRFINKFDDGKKVEPFNFYLKLNS